MGFWGFGVLIAMVISIEMIQLYKVTRLASFRNLPQGVAPVEDH